MTTKIIILFCSLFLNANAMENRINSRQPKITIGFTPPSHQHQTLPHSSILVVNEQPKKSSYDNQPIYSPEADDSQGMEIRYRYYQALATLQLLNPPHKEDMLKRLAHSSY